MATKTQKNYKKDVNYNLFFSLFIFGQKIKHC